MMAPRTLPHATCTSVYSKIFNYRQVPTYRATNEAIACHHPNTLDYYELRESHMLLRISLLELCTKCRTKSLSRHEQNFIKHSGGYWPFFTTYYRNLKSFCDSAMRL